MINIFESISKSSTSGLEASKKLATTTAEYAKLKAFHLMALSATSITKMMIIGSLVSIGMLFISISGAIAIGDYLENTALGYLIIGSVYVFFGIIIFLMRKLIEKTIIKKLSKKVFD